MVRCLLNLNISIVTFNKINTISINKLQLKFIKLLILSNIYFFSLSQEDTNVTHTQQVTPVRIDRDFNLKYQQSLWRIKRAYPLAIEANKIILAHEKELASIEKKRKKKSYAKELNQELKADFTFILKDLYVEEGEMLMKLIHRETGMTVYDIISKYKSKSQASLAHVTFAMYGHNTKIKYDPEVEDWITEIVIQDIETGKIKFDKSVQKVDKELFKSNMKTYNETKKKSKKTNRKNQKEKKKQKKASPK